VASALLGTGLQRGDKVAVQLPNLPQFLFTYFGLMKAGLVMVPLNPLLRAPEVAHHLQDSDAKVVRAVRRGGVQGAAQVEGVTTFVVNLPGNDRRPEGRQALRRAVLRRLTPATFVPDGRRRDRGAAVHERHDRQAEGRRAPPISTST
jgi:long-subunit acyl-CoA synthetase (AMP-forming)